MASILKMLILYSTVPPSSLALQPWVYAWLCPSVNDHVVQGTTAAKLMTAISNDYASLPADLSLNFPHVRLLHTLKEAMSGANGHEMGPWQWAQIGPWQRSSPVLTQDRFRPADVVEGVEHLTLRSRLP